MYDVSMSYAIKPSEVRWHSQMYTKRTVGFACRGRLLLWVGCIITRVWHILAAFAAGKNCAVMEASFVALVLAYIKADTKLFSNLFVNSKACGLEIGKRRVEEAIHSDGDGCK